MAQNQGILGLEGFTGVVGGLLFFAFWDTAVNVAIGDLGIQLIQKYWGFAK